MIELQQLSLRFSSGFCLGPLSKSEGPGLVHVQGPNGSGKSTLFRLLSGALLPTGGRALVSQRDLHADHRARALVGWVPAGLELPPFFTVREAWRSAAALRGVRSFDGEALEEVLGLPPQLRLEHGSSGQRRKASLLVAMVGDPPVMLLDETLAHLDRTATTWLLGQLERWRSDKLVLITHHGTLAVPADRTWCLAPVPS